MVKHIILWTLNPELSEEEKQTVKAGIKAGLEGLVGKVPGLLDVKVHIDGRLASSNADVMLDSTLESEEALKGYAVHPEHVAVANGKVRPYTVQRSCLDFEIEITFCGFPLIKQRTFSVAICISRTLASVLAQAMCGVI